MIVALRFMIIVGIQRCRNQAVHTLVQKRSRNLDVRVQALQQSLCPRVCSSTFSDLKSPRKIAWKINCFEYWHHSRRKSKWDKKKHLQNVCLTKPFPLRSKLQFQASQCTSLPRKREACTDVHRKLLQEPEHSFAEAQYCLGRMAAFTIANMRPVEWKFFFWDWTRNSVSTPSIKTRRFFCSHFQPTKEDVCATTSVQSKCGTSSFNI